MSSVYWHATSSEEEVDVKRFFPGSRGYFVAANIPKKPLEVITNPDKANGELRLVFLALISEMKNLLLLLSVLKTLPLSISLDIYGPVKNEKYWDECQSLLNELQDRVQYKGKVEPVEVQATLSQYHAMVLLTRGENFGHALFESLSVGRPVITSHFTPWNELKKHSAGRNVDITSFEDCRNGILELASFDQDEFNQYCNGAHTLARTFFQSLDIDGNYSKVFI
jgi:glycosyltransferase involved in cell wall biosynthesis